MKAKTSIFARQPALDTNDLKEGGNNNMENFRLQMTVELGEFPVTGDEGAER